MQKKPPDAARPHIAAVAAISLVVSIMSLSVIFLLILYGDSFDDRVSLAGRVGQ